MNNEGYNIQDLDMESGEQTEEKVSFDIGVHEIETELPVLEDVDHPLVPEVENEYIPREINGKTDLEIVAYGINDPDYFVMLEGEAGVGKNRSIKELASRANWPLIRVNFGVGTTYESLVGRYVPADNEDDDIIDRAEAVERTAMAIQKAGSFSSYTEQDDITFEEARELAESSLPEQSNFARIDGLLTKAVKNGWWFDADEINAAEPEALMPLNGLTEDRNSRYLAIEEEGEIIEPHPRFRFIATRNPITYSGTGDMNSALESRAYIFQYDYHEKEALKQIVSERTDIVDNESQQALESLIGLTQAIRQQEQEGTQFVTKISTRDIIKICRLTDIMSIRNATKTVMLGIADPTDEQPIKSEINSINF